MVQITYVNNDGVDKTVEADVGSNLMQTALANNIDGIVGECGGNALCATCHVYVDSEWKGQLPPVADFEDELLDCTVSPRTDRSRLGCQIPVTPDVEGIIVHLPEEQG